MAPLLTPAERKILNTIIKNSNSVVNYCVTGASKNLRQAIILESASYIRNINDQTTDDHFFCLNQIINSNTPKHLAYITGFSNVSNETFDFIENYVKNTQFAKTYYTIIIRNIFENSDDEYKVLMKLRYGDHIK